MSVRTSGSSTTPVVPWVRSEFCKSCSLTGCCRHHVRYSRLHHGIPHHLWNPNGHRRPHWPSYCRRLLPHSRWRAVGCGTRCPGDGGGSQFSPYPHSHLDVVYTTVFSDTLQVYPAGSVHHLVRGEVKQYKMHRGCFALEYARGQYSH